MNIQMKQYIHDMKIGIQCSTEVLYINAVQDTGIRIYVAVKAVGINTK